MEDTTFKFISEIGPFDTLNKFGLDVVNLAKKIPEIGTIVAELTSAGIRIWSRDGNGAEYLPFDSITIGKHHTPIDILGALVHEYTHWKHLIKTYQEMFSMTREDYIEYLIQQEIIAYSAQGEFLKKHMTSIADTIYRNQYTSYIEGHIEEHVRTFIVPHIDPVKPYHQAYYGANYDKYASLYKEKDYATANKV